MSIDKVFLAKLAYVVRIDFGEPVVSLNSIAKVQYSFHLYLVSTF